MAARPRKTSKMCARVRGRNETGQEEINLYKRVG